MRQILQSRVEYISPNFLIVSLQSKNFRFLFILLVSTEKWEKKGECSIVIPLDLVPVLLGSTN